MLVKSGINDLEGTKHDHENKLGQVIACENWSFLPSLDAVVVDAVTILVSKIKLDFAYFAKLRFVNKLFKRGKDLKKESVKKEKDTVSFIDLQSKTPITKLDFFTDVSNTNEIVLRRSTQEVPLPSAK